VTPFALRNKQDADARRPNADIKRAAWASAQTALKWSLAGGAKLRRLPEQSLCRRHNTAVSQARMWSGLQMDCSMIANWPLARGPNQAKFVVNACR